MTDQQQPSTNSTTSTAMPAGKTANLARVLARRKLRADQSGALIAGGIMAGAGWAMLYTLVRTVPPLAFPRWLFFILLYIAVTGSVLPFVWYINQRFSRFSIITGWVVLRQSMWFGLYAVTLAWLQMTRALNGVVVVFLALSMLVIEIFVRFRERANR
jgi:hypothetical protein